MTQKKLSSFSKKNIIPLQTMKVYSGGTNVTSDMISIPAQPNFKFVVNGVEIEGGTSGLGLDYQYPWESSPQLNHSKVLKVKAFHVAKYPVTNAQYFAFLTESRYFPLESANFLRDWSWFPMKYPAGWDNKPVTWISVEDALAYCNFYKVRLLNEWEWAVAASGGDSRRIYPWGTTWDPARVPPVDLGGTMRPPTDVDAFPSGASPFGVTDLLGNTYTWLNTCCDEHTCTAVLRGVGYYQPPGSKWYWQSAARLDQHAKYLLMRPSLDRSGGIGFRVATD
jgi:formylglycine-generating enzyme required for sulfatase activity